MDRSARFPIQRYASLEEMKADEYHYWQRQPAHVRMKAVTEITMAAFDIQGEQPDAHRLQRTIRHLRR